MPRDIVHHLAATRGMADMHGVLQIEMRSHCGKIISVMIHVVAIRDLRRAAMPAPVMRNDAIAVLEEKQHLGVPVIGRQRPAVAEHDGLTFAPVLVKDLNAVFGCNCAHGTPCKSALLRMRSSSSPLTQ